MSLSGALESANKSHSSVSSVVEMSSSNVDNELESVTVDATYACNTQPNVDAKYESMNLRACSSKVFFSILFCLLCLLLIVIGFCFIGQPTEMSSSKRIPMSEPFMKSLRLRVKEVSFNLAWAKQYCLPPTTLSDCELDWHKLKSHMDSNIVIVDQRFAEPSHRNDQCFVTTEKIACFGAFNGTQYEVKLDQFHFKPTGIMDFNWTGVKFYARYILAVGPYDYFLVTGDRPEQFCWLDLLGHERECKTYEKMITAKQGRKEKTL